jgi:alpha-ketoglutarate-dependent taurine dioxygenase
VGDPDATAIDFVKLREKGWVCVKGIKTKDALLRLVALLGCLVPAPTGEIVKELTVTDARCAREGTLSAVYGRGEFPFHTDTAFWPTPARYLIFRARGDTRRRTKIKPFANFLSELGAAAANLAAKSVWVVKVPSINIYCSMQFRTSCGVGWRYDGRCMRPANRAARELDEMISLNGKDDGQYIDWHDGEAVIVSNWTTLHGRGSAPEAEGERILERIYVR